MTHVVQWRDKLPIGWEALPLKVIAEYKVSSVDKVIKDEEDSVLLCNYTDVYKNNFITNDLEFMHGSASEEEILKYSLQIGDILITKDSESWDDIAIPALVKEVQENLLCGYHLAIIRPNKDKIYPPFLFRCFQSKEIRLQMELASTGVTRFGLPKDEIGHAVFPIPDIRNQKRIADFIERETAEIDDLISSKSSLLNVLSEKRHALITEAVTKGLNSFAKMKDSCIPWLGNVPEHWEIKKVKHIATKIGSGITPNGGATIYQKEGIPLLRSQNVHFDGLHLDDVAFISEEMHESMSNSKVFSGDVLLNITGASIGRCFYYNGELGEANVNQHVCIIRPNKKVLTEYLYLLLSSDTGQTQVSINQIGGGREGLTFESLKSFIFPIPKINEQEEIINAIRVFNEEITNLEQMTKQSIDLLKERRSSLISTAVTGQIKMLS